MINQNAVNDDDLMNDVSVKTEICDTNFRKFPHPSFIHKTAAGIN